MPAFVTFGRILFAVLFIYTGATKLFAIQATADFIASKVTIPALLAPYTSKLETMTGMPLPHPRSSSRLQPGETDCSGHECGRTRIVRSHDFQRGTRRDAAATADSTSSRPLLV